MTSILQENKPGIWIYSVTHNNGLRRLHPAPKEGHEIVFTASEPDGTGLRDLIMSGINFPIVLSGTFSGDIFGLIVKKSPRAEDLGKMFFSSKSDMGARALAGELINLVQVNLAMDVPPHAVVAFLE